MSTPSVSPGCSAISEAFQQALRDLGYPFEVFRRGSELRFRITTPDRAKYRAQLLIDEV